MDSLITDESQEEKSKVLKDLDNSFISGFQLAANAGPLCHEPMTGVAFIVEDIFLESYSQFDEQTYGPFSGQIISAMKEVSLPPSTSWPSYA